MDGERLVLVRNDEIRETELCVIRGEDELAPIDDLIGTYVIAETRYGDDLCRVLGPVSAGNAGGWDEKRRILRPAVERDLERREAFRREANRAMDICRDRVVYHGLRMQLVRAHFLYDGLKLLFFFTAENRVDFRALVKDLVSHFRTRIELRQIGVREEARMSGGMGVCGRSLCCNAVSDRLEPVSIKMAKSQNLSLNSMKISGPCGRLLCCLAYEYRFYEDARRQYPTVGCTMRCDGSSCKVVDVNYLSRKVYLTGEEGGYVTVPLDQVTRRDGSWEVLRQADSDTGADRA